MPQYGDPDYDPNFDDSPPATPNRSGFVRPSAIRLVLRKLWRLRASIIIFLFVVQGLYFWWNSRGFFPKRSLEPRFSFKNVNWKHYAYTQYATDSAHLCNAVMVFEALHRLRSKAQRVLFYPETMDTEIDGDHDRDSQLLRLAAQKYNVKLIPTNLQAKLKPYPHKPTLSTTHHDQIGWDRSITKLLAFNQTQYLRVIHLDNDITLQQSLDDLFLLPSAPVAMTRAYWLNQSPVPVPKGVETEAQASKELSLPLSSHLIVIEPSALETARIWQEIGKNIESPLGTSMDALILNQLYKDTAMILPHKGLALRTGELRRSADDHETYLGMSSQPLNNGSNSALPLEKWSSEKMIREARIIHFAGDEPLPKPWIMWPKRLLKVIRPQCEYMPGTPAESGCKERERWTKVYEDFRKRRKEVCALLSIPAPYWGPTEEGESHVSQ